MTVSSFPIPSSGPDTEEMLDAGVWNDVKSKSFNFVKQNFSFDANQ